MNNVIPIGKLKCMGVRCRRILGEIMSNGTILIKSKRSSWPIQVIVEHGQIKCRDCNTIVTWDSNKGE